MLSDFQALPSPHSRIAQIPVAGTAPQMFSPTQQRFICDGLLGLSFLLLIGLIPLSQWYDRYAHERALRLKQQIENLERIWHHSVHE